MLTNVSSCWTGGVSFSGSFTTQFYFYIILLLKLDGSPDMNPKKIFRKTIQTRINTISDRTFLPCQTGLHVHTTITISFSQDEVFKLI